MRPARPHRRNELALALLGAALLFLLALAPISQARVLLDSFSGSGSLGGQFNLTGGAPGGVALNTSGAGGVTAGTLYAVDPIQNRIERFSSTGAFERAWGFDTIASSQDERQLVVVKATAGTYTLSFKGFTTNPIAFNANSGVVDNALDVLPSIGADANVTVESATDGYFLVAFTGTLAAADQPQMTAAVGSLNGTVEITTQVDGTAVVPNDTGSGFEVCTVAIECKAGIATPTSANGGQLNDPNDIAVNQTTGDVYVYETNNRRVSEFDAGGSFLRTWGWDTIASGKPNDTGTGFEVCAVASECKQAALTGGGAGGGQFGGDTFGSNVSRENSIAIDSSGNVWVTDAANRRIQEFGSDGHFVAVYGWDVLPPGKAGNVEVSESQQLTPNPNVIGGTFKLSFKGTDAAHTSASIASSASAANVQSALEGIAAIGAGNVAVSGSAGGPWTVDFQGALANASVPQIATDGSALLGTQTLTPEEVAGGSFALRFKGFDAEHTSVAIPWNAEAADVQSALEGIAAAGPGNVSVSGPERGPWTVAFTGSLAGSPQPAISVDGSQLSGVEGSNPKVTVTTPAVQATTLVEGSGLEKCTSTAPGDCQAGAPGEEPGQFFAPQFSLYPRTLAFDSAGNLYVGDKGRIERFNPSTTSASDFLTDADFASSAVIASVENGERIAVTRGQGSLSGILEYDLSGSLIETSIPDSGFFAFGVTDIAYDPAGDRLYVGLNSSHPDRIAILDEAPAPAATADPVTTFDDESATLPGTVDPAGAPVQCTFEYSDDQVKWIKVPVPGCGALDVEGGPQPISAQIKGLEPGGHYFVRLVVSRLFDNSSAVTPPAVEFTTLSLPPLLSQIGAARVTDTSAYLVGRVRPRSQLSHYRFQYTTSGFSECGTASNPGCHETPEESIAGAAQAVAVAHLTGLQPDTEYEFKLIADNIGGAAESSAFALHTRSEPLPPPAERAYEVVTPTDKNGGGAVVGWRFAAVSPDGEAVGFCTTSIFGEPAAPFGGKSFCGSYASRRFADGWRTRAFQPQYCRLTGKSGMQTVSLNIDAAFVTANEDAECPLPPLDPAAEEGPNAYLETDLLSEPPSHRLLTPEPAGANYGAASDDFSHVVYASSGLETANAPAGAFNKLYEWDEGTIRLVSVDPSGKPFASTASIAGSDSANAVSADGNRVFFLSGSGNAQEIYMRQAGAITTDVSESECTASCGAAAADEFRWATPSGFRALFTSKAKLTNAATPAGANLYLYTHSAKPANNTNLTLLSADAEAGDGSQAEVLGVLGASDSGEMVYFVAKGQLVAGAPTTAGAKLYRWQRNGGSPTLTYLATLEEGDANGNWTSAGVPPNAIVTPDGQRLLVQTRVELDPYADTDEDRDLYLWDEADGWRCVSCQTPGEDSRGDVIYTPGTKSKSTGAFNNERRIVMSDDGSRVFFATPDQLVSADVNGNAADAYEWHEGSLGLVSSGDDPGGVVLLGAGRDARDVLFYTDSRLVGLDTDQANDIYDARIGGGFPEPPPEPVPCEGESCRGASSAAPQETGAGTAAFEGPGNQGKEPGRKGCPKGKRQVRRKGKARCVKPPRRKHHRGTRANHDRRNAR